MKSNECMTNYNRDKNSLRISVECDAGKYRYIKEVECKECKDNTISQAGAAYCTVCPEGTEANANKTRCGRFISCYHTTW